MTTTTNHDKNWWSYTLRHIKFACLSFEVRLAWNSGEYRIFFDILV